MVKSCYRSSASYQIFLCLEIGTQMRQKGQYKVELTLSCCLHVKQQLTAIRAIDSCQMKVSTDQFHMTILQV